MAWAGVWLWPRAAGAAVLGGSDIAEADVPCVPNGVRICSKNCQVLGVYSFLNALIGEAVMLPVGVGAALELVSFACRVGCKATPRVLGPPDGDGIDLPCRVVLVYNALLLRFRSFCHPPRARNNTTRTPFRIFHNFTRFPSYHQRLNTIHHYLSRINRGI